MNEYELTIQIKNAYMLNAMRKNGIKNAAELQRLTGVTQTTIGKMLALKLTAYRGDGDGCTLRSTVKTIADKLCVNPEELFPPQHLRDPLLQNKFTAQVSADQLKELSHNSTKDPCELLEFMEAEDDDAFNKICDAGKLTDREKKVLSLRFEEQLTLEEVAKVIGVSRERIRQNERLALRKMRGAAARKGDELINAAGNFSSCIPWAID